jgi:hypothetical protein
MGDKKYRRNLVWGNSTLLEGPRLSKRKNVLLRGGLGNVLFQVAFGISLAKQGYRVTLNSRDCGIAHGGRSEIENFIDSTFDLGSIRLKSSYSIAHFSVLHPLLRFLGLLWISEVSIDVPESDLPRHYIGYFQRHEIAAILLDDLQSSELQDLNLCVVHVRSGDYLLSENAEFGILPDDYYLRAAMELANEVDTWVVVSDSEEAANRVCDLLRPVVKSISTSSQSTLKDFALIRRASHRVIANSTFSLWAALLGSSGSFTIAPDPFFKSLPFDRQLLHGNWRISSANW